MAQAVAEIVDPAVAARQEAISQGHAQETAFLAALPTMSDQALVNQLAANQRSYWTRVERGEHIFPESMEFVPLKREYDARAQQRPMPPIPMPTDIPAYAAHVQSLELTQRLDQLPRGWWFGPIKGYIASVVQATTGAESDYSRGSRLRAAAITALPVAAAGVTYHQTESVGWSALVGVGSIYAMSLLVLVGMAGVRY